MKKLLWLSLAAAFLAGALMTLPAASARAEKIDFAQITCAQFLEFESDEMAYLYFWLDGYVSAKTNNTVLDTDGVENDVESLLNLCRKNPDATLLKMLNQ